MNFNLAQSQLNAEGIACKTVLVTDDIMSASKEEFHKRRGIAGDLFVFKVAAAAAEAGYSLDEVYRVAVEANERTRTIGVAFSGCTLPGKTEPLFTVPKGRMALGLGIHGEPGLSESDIPTSKELALELVTHLLEETPDSCRNDSNIRLCVLVNGLGGVKYEELYVLYNNISAILKEKNIEIVEPEIGELVTSFEMAGASLTFTWLNDELEDFWKKPTYTPGYKKGTISLGSGSSQGNSSQEEKKVISKGRSESHECAKNIVKILELIETNTAERADEYGLLDSYAGDGDHGIGMARGAHAAATAAKQYLDAGAGAGSTLEAAADSWSDKAGGTSGIIWGIILREIGKEFGDSVKPSAHVVASAVARASAEVTKFGKAQIGDKTLVDVLIPFSQKLVSENGKSLAEAWRSASNTATSAAAETANLLPKIGRARPHAEKSLGHQDPGATSLAMIISTIANFLEGK